MRYTGLLTPEEARKCVEAGYGGPWVNYKEGYEATTASSFAWDGCFYAPLPGHFLPMATAPRDGQTRIYLSYKAMHQTRVAIAIWFVAPSGGGLWHLNQVGGLLLDEDCIGWAPVVQVNEG